MPNNREKAIRQGVYDAIKDSLGVPVYDSKLESNDTTYVILNSQSAVAVGNMRLKMWQCSIDIEVYDAQQESATFDRVDEIGKAIEDILTPNSVTGGNGIIAQDGWDMTNVYLNSALNVKMQNYQNGAGVIANKQLQFSLTIIKQ